MKRTIALLAALIVALTVAATPAVAVSVYCDDLVAPVTLSVTHTSPAVIQAVTSAPINSTAKLYVQKNQAGPYVLAESGHDIAGTNYTFSYIEALTSNWVILNYGDTGQVWYGPGGGTLAYCRSPIRTA